jgi:type VI protein secretion system component VasF
MKFFQFLQNCLENGNHGFGLFVCHGILLWGYDGRMKSNPKASAEYTNFENAMRTILKVSKADVTRAMAEEKLANAGKPKRGPKPKTSASGHASGDRG